jgi:hypothetical protein
LLDFRSEHYDPSTSSAANVFWERKMSNNEDLRIPKQMVVERVVKSLSVRYAEIIRLRQAQADLIANLMTAKDAPSMLH